LKLYFDACVLVPLFIEEDASSRVNALLDQVGKRIYLSDLGISEVSAGISRRVRERKANDAIARAILAALDEWIPDATIRIPIESEDVKNAIELVRQFELKLLTPDAIHLALCQRMGLTLVTLDKRLSEAAVVLGVGVVLP
jgi:uncharacterized protein